MSQALIQMLSGARQAQGAKAAIDPAALHFLTRLSADSKAADLNWRLGRPAPGMFEGLDAPVGDDISGMVAATGAPRRMMEQGAWEQAISRIPPPDNMYNNAFAQQKRDARLMRMDPSEQSQSLDFINLLDRQRGSQSVLDSVTRAAEQQAQQEQALRKLLGSMAYNGSYAAGIGAGTAAGMYAANEAGQDLAGLVPQAADLPPELPADDIYSTSIEDIEPSFGDLDQGAVDMEFQPPQDDAAMAELIQAIAAAAAQQDQSISPEDAMAMSPALLRALSGEMGPEEAIGPLSSGPDMPVIGGLEDEEHPDWPRVRELIRSGLSEQDAWNAVAGGR